jgi:protein-tyrosine phosphatase
MTYTRYELHQQGEKPNSWFKIASVKEDNEEKAIQELLKKAQDTRDYDENLKFFINLGKRGPMRIVRADITVLDVKV